MKRRSSNEPHEYELAIPERDELMAALKESGKPLNSKEITSLFDLKSADHSKAIRQRLKAMVRDGQLIRNRRGRYGLVDKMDLVPGRIIGNSEGFGFLVPDTGSEDIYLSGKVMRSLLHGDRAVVRISGRNRRGKLEGSLVEVLERANEKIVGRFFKEKNIGFVVPDNKRLHQDVFIPPGSEKNARHGQYVVARLTQQPDRHRQPVGKIQEVIGDHISTGIATDVAIRAYDLPHEWPAGVDKEIQVLDPKTVNVPAGYRDLRKNPFVTIDGEDARDFDDAVYCCRKGDSWQLSVAIADVSHYVRPGTGLDKEAINRGTSVYFPDRVIPMLPEILSNELCSLKPGVDRLALVCEMNLSPQGEVTEHRFYNAVIRSSARLSYTEMAGIVVDKDSALRDKHADLNNHLDDLFKLYQLMHKARARRAMLDFDTVESRIRFDKTGKIVSIDALVRNDAHKLIEEFMLAANISAARYLIRHKVPTLFRIHETPKAEKIADLREFLKALGLSLGGGEEPDAKDYANLMKSIVNRPDTRLIHTVLLRSMPLAYYGDENLGHFGLAFDAYTHFTSPIRRYPDLLVHRAIKSIISGGKQALDYKQENMHEFGMHCSSTERRAEEASREVLQRLKCEFMKDRIGEEFSGTITGVTGFGLFVALDEYFVEGLVHVTALPADYYHHDPIHHVLRGERTGREYRLSNKLKVKLIRVDTEENKIDFELVNTDRRSGKPKKHK